MPHADLTAQDRWDIQQTLALLDHALDTEQWDRLGSLVTADLRLETPHGTFDGPAGVRAFEQAAHPGARPSHHVLNTAIRPGDIAGTAIAWSRILVVTHDQQAAGGDAIDALVHEGGRWLLRERRLVTRNRERGADGRYTTAGAVDFADWLGA
jgi:hypothetical protein